MPVNCKSSSIQKAVHFVVGMLPSLVADWAWLFGDHCPQCRILQELTIFMLSTVGMLLWHLERWNVVTKAVKGLHCLSDRCSCPSEIYCRCSGCNVCLDLQHWGGASGELGVHPLWPWASSSTAVLDAGLCYSTFVLQKQASWILVSWG